MTNIGEPVLLHSSGDAAVGLVQPPRQRDRLAALLTVTTVTGPRVQIKLQLCDVARLASDLIALLAADADEACRWWYRLSSGDRRPGTLRRAQ